MKIDCKKFYSRIHAFCNPNNPRYRPDFRVALAKLAPEWLVTRSDVANEKKEKLLKLARAGKPRPKRETPLGSALSTYTWPTHNSYDPKFDAKIRRVAPSWFVSRSDVANAKKEELLKLACARKPRPKHKTPLGSALCDYTCSAAECYDPEFDAKIRRTAPSWFISRSDIANAKKEELLKLARARKPRPKRKTPLGSALSSYVCLAHNCYDPKFDAKIRRAAPQWFRR